MKAQITYPSEPSIFVNWLKNRSPKKLHRSQLKDKKQTYLTYIIFIKGKGIAFAVPRKERDLFSPDVG